MKFIFTMALLATASAVVIRGDAGVKKDDAGEVGYGNE